MECLFDGEASEKAGASTGSCGLSVGDAQSRSDLLLHLQTVDRLQRARRIERWGAGLGGVGNEVGSVGELPGRWCEEASWLRLAGTERGSRRGEIEFSVSGKGMHGIF